jgi:predicted RecB family endonuclease
MDREEDACKVHEAATEIAMALGTSLMNMLPDLTAKYNINSQSFIVAAVQSAVKVAVGGVASVTHMNRDESIAFQRELNAAVFDTIRRKLPSLQEEHDRIWQVASDEGRNATVLVELSETFDRIEQTLADYGQRQ